MRTLRLLPSLIVILSFVTLTSCGLKAIPSDYTSSLAPMNDITSLGSGKVMIYNGADILHSIDNTSRLNIWINGKPMGQLKVKEYTVLELPNGSYEFTVLHLDMVNMRSKHQVVVNEDTRVIRIEPTLTSNKLTVTNVWPSNFEKLNRRP